MRDTQSSSSRTSIDAHAQTKIGTFFVKYGAFAISFPLTNRCRKHCGRNAADNLYIHDHAVKRFHICNFVGLN